MADLLKDLHPALAAAYTATAAAWLLKYPTASVPSLDCTYRSPAVQAKLYAQGRTAPGPRVTNAKPGQSAHNHLPALAFDIKFIKNGKLDWTDNLFQAFADLLLPAFPGITWGGNFHNGADRPHFELTNFRTMK